MKKSKSSGLGFVLRFLFYLAVCPITIIDDRYAFLYPLKLRRKTKLIQVWHALGAFKKMGGTRSDISPDTTLSHRNYSAAVVSSQNVIPHYAEAFNLSEEKIFATGAPRTDMFFDENYMQEIKQSQYDQIPVLRDKRIILFAPTYRGKDNRDAHYPESFLDMDRLYESLGEHDLFIIKHHPFIKNKTGIPENFGDKIIDLSFFREVNNLLLITDLLITDYSSCIFEYALLKRPIVFYAPDLERYGGNRGLHYDYDEYVYGTKCTNFSDLLKAIKKPELDTNKLEKFTKRFLQSCDGNSTKRFLEKFIPEGKD
ncbi:MAG: CDP-glycerol glycerophosphotransferase family protein [Oscillospiraceae bacterium]|nr:CDP-glycerol glycerophosphotransferase family protein [Oscillospiraceae bacterium]